jgi:hypothetical protein
MGFGYLSNCGSVVSNTLAPQCHNLTHNAMDCFGRDFFGDCPGQEEECAKDFIGVDPELAARHVYQFYRFRFLDNYGGTQICV